MRYVFDDYELDTQVCELRRAGAPIALTPKAYAVLVYLVEHRERLISKEELLDQLWPETYVDDSAVKRTIMAVRRAIEERPNAPQRIKTQRGQGYRFLTPVTVADPAANVPASAPVATTPMQGPETEVSPPLQPDTPAPQATAQRQCPACQHNNRATAWFCVRCGTTLEVTCPQCGDAISHPAAFCPACGQRLLAATAAEPAEAHPAEPSRVEQADVAPERKLVTMLHCGLADASGLVERGGLDALHSAMQGVHELVRTEAQRYGGTLQTVTGESVLVWFGVPVAQEDHALRAVLMALGLQRRLQEESVFSHLASAVDVACCLALHTGRVVVGPLGGEQPGTAAVVGDVTTLAAAIARQAVPNTVVASVETLRLVQADVDAVELAPLQGVEHPAVPLPLYQVRQVTPRHTPQAATTGRSLSPFVGREAELAILRARFARVEQGRGQVVAMSGEPGIGKSRLLARFQQELMAHTVTSLQGHCRSYGCTIPYGPLRDLLRLAWGLAESESPETLTAKIGEGLQAVTRDPQPWMPSLLHLFGIELEHRGPAAPPQVRKAQTFDALLHLILESCRQRPCLLVIEDLHWIDATSEAFLGSLVERLAGLPLFLLVTWRPEYRPAWLERSYVTHIALQPLDPDDCRQLARTALPQPLLSSALEQQVLAQAAGNPFFLEELLHAAAEQHAAPTALAVPDTIQAVVASRIDRLPATAKRLLQTAAVIGTEVPVALLRALIDWPEDALQQHLAQLQASEFLYETQLFPEPVYAFKHALTRDVAYGSLVQAPRRALHRRMVETLETLPSGRLSGQIDRLAQHAYGAALWDKAGRYFRQAGIKAMARAANREAVTSFEQALQCIAYLPTSRDTQEQAVDIRLDLRNALLQLGENARCLEVLREARPLVEDLDDTLRLGWLSSFLSTHYLVQGDADQAIACGERALALAAVCDDAALQVDTHLHLGQAYHACGNYPKAVDMLRWNVTALKDPAFQLQGGPAGLLSLHSLPWLVWCLAELGAFSEGIAYGVEAIRIAKAAKHPYGLVAAYGSVGLLHLRRGEVQKALPLLERGLSLCQQANIALMLPTLAATLGTAYAVLERLSDALPLLEQAAAQATAVRIMVYQAFVVAALSEAYLRAGHIEAASTHAERAFALCQTHQEAGQQAWTLRLLGDIAARRQPLSYKQAETFYRQALSQAEALGMQPLMAHCYLGLSRLYGQRGWAAKGRAALARALRLYCSLDMPFWRAQAEAALAP